MSREREGLQERIKEQINNGTHGHDEIHWIMARECQVPRFSRTLS